MYSGRLFVRRLRRRYYMIFTYTPRLPRRRLTKISLRSIFALPPLGRGGAMIASPLRGLDDWLPYDALQEWLPLLNDYPY